MHITRSEVRKKTTNRGTSLVYDLMSADLCLDNDVSSTFFRPSAAIFSLDLTFHFPGVSLSWEASPDTQGSDHFPNSICVADDRSSLIKRDFTFRSFFKGDIRPVKVSIIKNLGAATSHIFLPANSPASLGFRRILLI